jgi:hypothetical protein
MKHNKLAIAATSGIVGLSLAAGTMAFAAGTSDAKSAEELKLFLDANPQVAAVVAHVETKTGGKVMEAEFDDDTAGNGVVEFEVVMTDGSEQEVLYTLADGSMQVDIDDDDDDDDDDNDNDNDDEAMEAGERKDTAK